MELFSAVQKMMPNDLVGKLNDRGYDAEGLHGDISQNYREVTLKKI